MLYSHDNVELICGDFFELTSTDMPTIHAIYDCKALIALPPEARKKYVNLNMCCASHLNRREYKMLVSQYQDIRQQFSLLKITSDKLQKDYDQLLEAHQQQLINLDSKHHAIIELQLKLKLSDEKNASLESDLSNANNKVHNLRHEHQFSSQEKANLEGQLKQLQSMLPAKKGALIG